MNYFPLQPKQLDLNNEHKRKWFIYETIANIAIFTGAILIAKCYDSNSKRENSQIERKIENEEINKIR